MTGRIVVTGAAGMLGSHLVRRLTYDGYRVDGIDVRTPDGPPAPGLRYIQGDVRDAGLVRASAADADAVIHCAAALPSNPAEVIRSVIVDGTRSVLAAAREARVPRVVHVSSTAVYGLPAVVPTPEEHPREPVDAYGHAKAEAEELAEKYRADGRCLCILRPKTFVGAGRMGLFAMLFEWADEGRNFPVLGRGDVRIQMLAIEDLVEAIVTVLDAPDEAANDCYNVAAASFGTIREDFQAVLDAAGFGRRVVSVPARPAVAALGLLERARLSPVYGRLLHKLLADSYVSTDKIRARLGFEPMFSNTEAILRGYASWRAARHSPSAARHSPGAARTAGKTSRDPWRQGALSAVKIFF
jgi:nucleoside-diphosphate-sugar epimerase